MTNPTIDTITTDADLTHPTLPSFYSPATDPSPLGIDNEEVVVLDVVSPASTAKNPYTPTVNASTPAAAGKDTEVSNTLAFFNPLANTAKKPRCNMLRGCFKITPNASGGMIIECKNCTHFWVSNFIFLFRKYVLYINSNSLSFLNCPLSSDQKVEVLQCNFCKRTCLAMSGSGN